MRNSDRTARKGRSSVVGNFRLCLGAAVALLAIVAAGADAAAADAPAVPGGTASVPGGVAWWGYRGPQGTGVVAGKPPTSCDEKTGKNIVWKVPMPNWGHSLPQVAGERVFVVSEGGWPESQDLPLIQCLDAKDGKELWRATLDHLPATALSAVDQQAARAAWHTVLADFRENYRLFNQYIYADETGRQAILEKFKALGRNYGGWRGGGYGQLRSLKPKCDEAKLKVAAKAGLTLATWQHNCGMGQSCFGQTFPTPVTDGRHVYVATAFGSFFCFDLEGKQLWCTYSPGKHGEYCRNGRSPLIYGDLLLSDVTALARGIDRKTGKVLWSHPVGEETWMNPVIITAGEKDVLLCFNRKAFLLPDGQPLKVEGATDFGAMAVVKYDERDVVFFTGGGEHGGWENKGNCDNPPPSAVRFSLAGDTLKGKVLWAGLGGNKVSSHTGLLYHSGKLYHAPTGSVYDPLSGKHLAGPADRKQARDRRVMPDSGHLLWIAGGHMYGLRAAHGGEGKPGQSGTLSVYTLDGKKVAESTFANAPVEGTKKTQIMDQNGYNTWMFSYACPFTIAGDRIYVRSYDFLWCIGEK